MADINAQHFRSFWSVLRNRGVRRHAPVGLLVGAVVFLLSLIWLITTVRSQVPVSRRDVWVRGRIVVWILLAYQVAYTVAAH